MPTMIIPVPMKKAIIMNIPDKPRRGYRTIRLPISEADYPRFEKDIVYAKKKIDQLIHGDWFRWVSC